MKDGWGREVEGEIFTKGALATFILAEITIYQHTEISQQGELQSRSGVMNQKMLLFSMIYQIFLNKIKYMQKRLNTTTNTKANHHRL